MTQRKLELMEPAREDVRDIGRFLAHRNQKAAESFITKLVEQFKSLTRQPYLNQSKQDWYTDSATGNTGKHGEDR